jgi:enoyl-[acyl-carrier-protein] reductase (NADH)
MSMRWIRPRVEAHVAEVAKTAGSVDISFNAISYSVVQNIPQGRQGGRDQVELCSGNAGMTDADAPTNVRDTLLGRLPRLAEVADTAVYLASAGAGAMTGAIVNLSCGAIID